MRGIFDNKRMSFSGLRDAERWGGAVDFDDAGSVVQKSFVRFGE